MRCLGAPFWLIESRAGEMVLDLAFCPVTLLHALTPRGELQASVTPDLLRDSPYFEQLRYFTGLKSGFSDLETGQKILLGFFPSSPPPDF